MRRRGKLLTSAPMLGKLSPTGAVRYMTWPSITRSSARNTGEASLAPAASNSSRGVISSPPSATPSNSEGTAMSSLHSTSSPSGPSSLSFGPSIRSRYWFSHMSATETESPPQPISNPEPEAPETRRISEMTRRSESDSALSAGMWSTLSSGRPEGSCIRILNVSLWMPPSR